MAERTEDERTKDLLAQLEWLRRLARRLTRDASSADDLVQDTLAAALVRRPALAGDHGLRAWLAAVARRLSAFGRRGEARRNAREQRSARPEAVEPADAVLARGLAGRALFDAVLALEEPYRACLLLRYAERLAIAEVAARQGVTNEAARQRISRGVAMVRARLERDEDPRTWSALVALGGATALRDLLPTGLAMGWTTKAAVGAVAVGAALFWMAQRGLRDEPSAPRTDATGSSIAIAADSIAADESRLALDVPDPGADRVAAGPSAPVATLALRLASNGEPLAGAAVSDAAAAGYAELERRVGACWNALGVAAEVPAWLAASDEGELPPPDPIATLLAGAQVPPFTTGDERWVGEADEHGRVPLPRLPSAQRAIVVRHPSAAPFFARSEWLAERVRRAVDGEIALDLAPRGELALRLVDALGEPVAGSFARIAVEPAIDGLEPRPFADEARWHGPSDEGGSIVVPDLPAGASVFVAALGPHTSRRVGARVPAPGDETALGSREEPLLVCVARVGALRGRVVWEDGAPAVGLAVRVETIAPLHAGPMRARPGAVGDDGAFRIDLAPAGAARWIVEPAGARILLDGVAGATCDVAAGVETDAGTLVVPRMAAVRGRVAFEPHLPGARFHVKLLRCGGQIALRGAGVDDGAFELQAPRGDCALVVAQTTEFGERELARLEVACPSDGVVVPVGALLGSIVAQMPDGLPAGATANVRATPVADRGAPQWLPDTTFAFPRLALADGMLATPPFPAGAYDVQILLDGVGTALLHDVVVPAGLAVHVGAPSLDGGTLQGSVVDGAGRAVTDARVIALAPSPARWDGAPEPRRERRVDAEGEPHGAGGWRMVGVDARRWTLFALADDGRASAVTELDLEAGETREIELVVAEACAIEGRVTRGGAPTAGVEVGWSYATLGAPKLSSAAPRASFTDGDGRFRLAPFVPGDYQVHVRTGGTLVASVRLAPGETARIDLELERETVDVALTLRGEPLGRDWTVSAVALDPGGALEGLATYAEPVGDGSFGLPVFPCATRIEAHSSEPTGQSFLVRLVDGDMLRAGAEIAFPVGEVVVAAPLDALAGARPRLVLLAAPGFGDLARGWPLSLPCRVEDGELRFLGVPAHARLELRHGGRTQSIETAGERVTHVDWPFGR